MAEKSKKSKKHTWEFARYFRAGGYGWKGTALASKRITTAVREIKSFSTLDSAGAASGAVLLIEKCWRALVHIDSSSGVIGTAVNNALVALTEIIGKAELPSMDRQKLTERIWESWQEEDYGYYDVLSELWTQLCVEPAIWNYWADCFLPIVKNVFESTVPGSYFKGSEPCLACLYETARYDELVALFQSVKKPMFDYQKYVIKVVAARGEIKRALAMIEERLSDSNSTYQAARLGEEILLTAGRIGEAYEKFAFRLPFQTTGLATLSAIAKKYPSISPQKILSDLLSADSGNERRYFAAARKIGLMDLAIEIAEKYDVEPKTLTTASKDYIDKDPNLSLKFGLLALQRYANGYGYEPIHSDVQKTNDVVCKAAVNAGKRSEVVEKIKVIAAGDKSIGKLVSAVVNSGQRYGNKIVEFRPRI